MHVFRLDAKMCNKFDLDVQNNTVMVATLYGS